MLEERTVAIVLRVRAYGESDKIVTFLTRDWGKVTGIAKGAKRSRRRFVNVLEPFTSVQLRFRPSRTNDLALILGCDLVRSFRAPSRDLQRYAFASYLVELIDVMVTGRESGEETFALLLHGLTVLEECHELPLSFLPGFELLLLTYVGYAPNVEGCQQCGLLIDRRTGSVAFSPSLRGVLCPRCHGKGGAALFLSEETVRLLSNPKERNPEMFLLMEMSSRVCREMRTVVTGLLSHHLARPLKSRAFLERTGFLGDSLVDDPKGE